MTLIFEQDEIILSLEDLTKEDASEDGKDKSEEDVKEELDCITYLPLHVNYFSTSFSYIFMSEGEFIQPFFEISTPPPDLS